MSMSKLIQILLGKCIGLALLIRHSVSFTDICLDKAWVFSDKGGKNLLVVVE